MCLFLFQSSNASAATTCGVKTGGNPDLQYAGLVVGFRAQDSKGNYRMPSTSGVSIKVDTMAWISTPPGGLVNYYGGGGRTKAVNFSLSAGDPKNCVAGSNVYGRVVLGYTNRTTTWVLDCDGSVRNHTSLQRFLVTPSGSPPGLRTGGYWSIDQYIPANHGLNAGSLGHETGSLSNKYPSAIISPENGDTAELIFTYHEPIDWSLTGTSSFDGPATVNPGNNVTFRHIVKNNGPNTAAYRYRVLYAHLKPGQNNTDLSLYKNAYNPGDWWGANSVNPGSTMPKGVGAGGVNGTDTRLNISNVENNDRLCELIQFTDATGPDSVIDNYNGRSSPSCVTVSNPPVFNLTPNNKINLDDNENPSKATYSYCVGLNPAATVNSIGAQVIVRLYKNSIPSPTYTQIYTSPTTTITVNKPQTCSSDFQYPATRATFNAGDQICIVASVSPASNTNSGYIDSPRICDTVVDMPVFRAFNGSVAAGQCTAGSTTNGNLAGWYKNTGGAPASYRGAATNLATLSSSNTIGFASARGESGSYGSNVLSFAKNNDNTKNSDTNSPLLGTLFTATPCLKDATKPSKVITLASGTVNLSSQVSNDNYYINGNSSIIAGTNFDKRASIFIDGDLYIKSNISYKTVGWLSPDNIPKLVIRVSGNIYIDSAVNQLDGVYIAKPNGANGGSIYTCAKSSGAVLVRFPDNELYNGCQNPLTVYGVFIANKVNLLRTYGSLRNADTMNNAAERFYLSPELYMNGTDLYSNGSSTNISPYDAIYNLPPIL